MSNNIFGKIREKLCRGKKEKGIDVASGDVTKSKVEHKGIWRRFFHTLKVARMPYLLLLLYIALNAVQSIVAVKVPQVNGNFFSGDASIESVSMFIGIELLLTAVSLVVLYVNHIIRYRMNRNLRNSLWGKILKLKPKYFDKVSPNTLISRITVDTESINAFLMDIVLSLVFSVYTLILAINEMNSISIKAGLILLAFLPLSVVISFIMGRVNLKFQNKLALKLSDLTGYLSELVMRMPIIKACNRQTYERLRGKKVINEYYKSSQKLIFIDVFRQAIGTVVGILPEMVIIFIGIKLLGDGTFDAEGWYIFYIYAGTFISFFSNLGSMFEQVKTLQGQLNRVSDVLYEDEEAVGDYADEIINSGDVIFDNVSFSYEEQKPVLENVSFTIPKNKNTVIVGQSGSGKSTVLKLFERIYTPNSGKITVSGEDINSYNIKSWRKKIAYVSQTPPLMSGTIRDNITYGIAREVTDEEIMQAAKAAHIDEFISDCDGGLMHEVGQFGGNLSGGQCQKICIARAILTGAEYLVLDEPTASLDMISANDIVNTLNELKGSRTIVVVSHDNNALRCADKIIIVNENHSISEGTADELISTSRYFKQLTACEEV